MYGGIALCRELNCCEEMIELCVQVGRFVKGGSRAMSGDDRIE